MTKVGAFLAGFALAAAAAAGLWGFVLAPRSSELARRTAAAERAVANAKRDASDYLSYAEAEQRRRRELETETETLRKIASAEPPKDSMPHLPQRPPAQDDVQPEIWPPDRLAREIERLTEQPRRVIANPRYPLVLRALKAKKEEGYNTLTQVLEQPMPNEFKAVAAVLLGALGDPRAGKPLLAAWGTATDPDVRNAILRGLANAPGDEQTSILLETWNDLKADSFQRRLAVHGLARRKHEIALTVAAGEATNATPPLRAQAMETLHAGASAGEWKDATLVPFFGKALRTADGDGQRRIALAALEGFWSKDSVADLEEFAASAKSTELATRARRAAEALKSDKPRPESAGAATVASDPLEPESQNQSAPPKTVPPR